MSEKSMKLNGICKICGKKVSVTLDVQDTDEAFSRLKRTKYYVCPGGGHPVYAGNMFDNVVWDTRTPQEKLASLQPKEEFKTRASRIPEWVKPLLETSDIESIVKVCASEEEAKKEAENLNKLNDGFKYEPIIDGRFYAVKVVSQTKEEMPPKVEEKPEGVAKKPKLKEILEKLRAKVVPPKPEAVPPKPEAVPPKPEVVPPKPETLKPEAVPPKPKETKPETPKPEAVPPKPKETKPEEAKPERKPSEVGARVKEILESLKRKVEKLPKKITEKPKALETTAQRRWWKDVGPSGTRIGPVRLPGAGRKDYRQLTREQREYLAQTRVGRDLEDKVSKFAQEFFGTLESTDAFYREVKGFTDWDARLAEKIDKAAREWVSKIRDEFVKAEGKAISEQEKNDVERIRKEYSLFFDEERLNKEIQENIDKAITSYREKRVIEAISSIQSSIQSLTKKAALSEQVEHFEEALVCLREEMEKVTRGENPDLEKAVSSVKRTAQKLLDELGEALDAVNRVSDVLKVDTEKLRDVLEAYVEDPLKAVEREEAPVETVIPEETTTPEESGVEERISRLKELAAGTKAESIVREIESLSKFTDVSHLLKKAEQIVEAMRKPKGIPEEALKKLWEASGRSKAKCIEKVKDEPFLKVRPGETKTQAAARFCRWLEGYIEGKYAPTRSSLVDFLTKEAEFDVEAFRDALESGNFDQAREMVAELPDPLKSEALTSIDHLAKIADVYKELSEAREAVTPEIVAKAVDALDLVIKEGIEAVVREVSEKTLTEGEKQALSSFLESLEKVSQKEMYVFNTEAEAKTKAVEFSRVGKRVKVYEEEGVWKVEVE